MSTDRGDIARLVEPIVSEREDVGRLTAQAASTGDPAFQPQAGAAERSCSAVAAHARPRRLEVRP
jgi:hypothetical protein